MAIIEIFGKHQHQNFRSKFGFGINGIEFIPFQFCRLLDLIEICFKHFEALHHSGKNENLKRIRHSHRFGTFVSELS